MTVDDVVKLIEACKNTSVTRLKFEKLEISFDQEIKPEPVISRIPQIEDSREVENREVENREVEQSILQDLIDDVESQVLMASDPLAFEAEMRNLDYEEETVYRRPKRNGVSQ